MHRRSHGVRTVVILATLLLMGLFGSATAQSAVWYPTVWVDVNGRVLSEPGYLLPSGRVLLPLRAVGEALGALVQYESSTRTPIVIGGATVIRTPLDSTTAYVNGQVELLDQPAMLLNPGTTYVPLRFVVESLGVASEDLRYQDYGGGVRYVYLTNAPRFVGSAYIPDERVVWAPPADTDYLSGTWNNATVIDPHKPGLGDPGYSGPGAPSAPPAPSAPSCQPGTICPYNVTPGVLALPSGALASGASPAAWTSQPVFSSILPMHGITFLKFTPRVIRVEREEDRTRFVKRDRLVDASCTSPTNRSPDEVTLQDKSMVKNTWTGQVEFPVKVVEVKLGFSLEKGEEYTKSTTVTIDPGYRVEYWQRDLFRPIYIDLEYRYLNLTWFFPHVDSIVRQVTVYQFTGERTHSTNTVPWSSTQCPSGRGG